MTERTAWTDPALNREFERVYKQINGTPERMVRLEEALKALGNRIEDVLEEQHEENERLRADVAREHKRLHQKIDALTKPGWSRMERLGFGSLLAAYLGVGAAVLAVIFG